MFVLAMTDAETAFLAARAEAHASRLGVSTFAHSALCGCQRADTYCDRCDRDFGPEILTFVARRWLCSDCVEEINAASAA